MRWAIVPLSLLVSGLPAVADEGAHGRHGAPALASPYAGQESRRIKSLSEQDIAELRAGRGWGLAKAAELNGMPGPAHLLELRRLRKISVFDTKIDDAGAARLANIPTLRILLVGRSSITAEGQALLSEAIPEIRFTSQ